MSSNDKGALSGVRILDLTQFEAGPSCTEALAWLGAEVVKLENPKGGDQGRLAASEDGVTDAHYFLIFNANKKSVTCDLKSEQGLTLVKQLITKADVMVKPAPLLGQHNEDVLSDWLGMSNDNIAVLKTEGTV